MQKLHEDNLCSWVCCHNYIHKEVTFGLNIFSLVSWLMQSFMKSICAVGLVEMRIGFNFQLHFMANVMLNVKLNLYNWVSWICFSVLGISTC